MTNEDLEDHVNARFNDPLNREVETLRQECDELKAECELLKNIVAVAPLVDEMKAENERLKFRLSTQNKYTCHVCWTNSYEPVETEEECHREHPHDGEHIRCLCCQQHEWLKERNDRIAELEAELAEARASCWCDYCGREVKA